MKRKAEGKENMKRISLREHYSMYSNQYEAAADIGVSEKIYQLWLGGYFKPCFRSVRKLAEKGIRIESFPD